MYRGVAHRLTLRTAIALTICLALLPLPNISLLISGAAQAQNQKGKPRPGRPEGSLPNLDEIRDESQVEREELPPVPSTIRAKKNEGKPWDGRRVGDPDPPGHNGTERGSAGSMVATRLARPRRHAHARALKPPPPSPDNQFVQNFFTWSLTVNPTSSETTYWYDQLRVAYAQGQTSLKLAAIELGRTLFESAAYAARNRDAHWYVYDLYKSYLMRDPDAGGWATWEGLVPTYGREYVRRGFEESGEFASIIANITPNGSATAAAASLVSARVDPRNQPRNGMLTRDASWSMPLLSLPGRAGLDLGLSLSYSSMVWTRSGPYIYFDEDNGFPSPGFRLGFPTVQRKVFDAQTARNSYLLITGSGHGVELRQVGTSNIYDAADSSYLRLTENVGSLWVHSTDGTRLSFTEVNGEFRCVEIKDRNGNYITVNYNTLGRITTINDTLNRVITFNYDGNANLLSITQAWPGQPAHQWVGFGWGTRTMQSSFTSGAVVGTANGTVLPVVTQVTLNDTSYFTFDYTNSLQVSQIRNYFGALERNSTTFTYETPAGDAPRLLDSRLSAHNWSGYNNVPSQVITQYSVAGDGACVMTTPDGTVYKQYYGTGWQKGLTTLSEVWSGGVRQKWSTTAWTQDNTAVGYEMNPRVAETNVYDASGNRRRTTIDYGPAQYVQFGLPYIVRDYAADAVNVIRETYTDYNLSQAYLDRRIIGLVSTVQLKTGTQFQSKTTYAYDDPGRLEAVPAAATQHDTAYSTSFTTRGNVTAVSRWDVTDIDNQLKRLTTYTNFYNTGTPKSTTDPAAHTTSITYTDSFSDTLNRNTFAYPTTLTDADGFSSTIQYNFDFGATTHTQSPTPAGQTQGVIQTMTYNNLAQLERVTTTNNGAYKRFWYGAEFTASYATVNNVADEAYSVQVTDGLGQVIGAVRNHPGSTGGYSLVNTVYNLMGRAWLQSNPTEVDATWATKGDDQAGAYYTQQTYDWQGRPLVTTNPDLTTKEASYSGCGCAGGAMVTLTDEGTISGGVPKRRQQRIYSDVLGRTVKTEVLNWQGGTVYSTAVNTYNARDQVTQVRQYAGAEGSPTFQDTTMTYDGYGRLKTKHVPEQIAGTTTTYNYNSDNALMSIIDARGAATNYAYNNRHLANSVSYTVPQGSTIAVPATVTYAYDAAGNRTSMIDGLGSVTYNYNSLSRMTSETRNISQPTPMSCSISYQYNLAGQVSSITDPNNKTINYTRDSIGQLSAITGPSFAGVTSYLSGLQYRAWGAVKHANYGNGKTSDATYNNRMKAASFLIPSVMSKTYDYYADGTLKFSSDLLDHRFDRLYRWDHAARITEAYSGAEARNEGTTSNRPYKQLYAYDAMGHLMQRTNSSWSVGPSTTTDSYTNNRHDPVGQLWQYDNDGNTLTMPGAAYTYDAGGRIDTAWSGSSATFGLDGDGKKLKTVEVTWDPAQQINVTTYGFSIYSSALGRVLTEKVTNDDPNSPYAYYTSTTFVYGDSGVIALQESNSSLQQWVSWEHRDPGNASYTTGNPARQQELDPMGNNQGISDASYQSIPDEGIVAPYPASNNPANPNMTYSIDGIRVSLDDFMQNLQIIFRGDLGLNEALARQSANDSNFQRRWVSTDRGVIATSFGVQETEAGDLIIFDKDVFQGEIGYWETSALSIGGSLAALIGAGAQDQLTTTVKSERWSTAPDVQAIRDTLGKMLKAGECADFIEDLLEALESTQNPTVPGSILDLFEKVNQQGGFIRGGLATRNKVSATVDGHFKSRNASIHLTSDFAFMVTTTDAKAQSVAAIDAFNVLHELVHHAGSKAYYTDRQVAVALSKMGHEGLPIRGKGETDRDFIARNSTYFSDILRSKCPPL